MPEPDSTGDGTRAASPGGPANWAAAVTSDGIPARIGKFEVRALLGEGAFGRVFLAFDAELERQVAIKVPKPEGLTPDLRERFIREARATAKIHHPNVCPVYHVGTEVDPPYIVMHYLAGTTLAAHLEKWKVLPPLHAVALAQKLALGMAAAHEKNVIHRDLKPQNVLFDPTRQLVLITDFGLARIGGQPGATAAGAVFGTPLYMSPEQARGEVDQIGPLSDVYSLGVILYRMLTGNVPFDGGVYEVLIQHCEKAPVPPSVARRGLDPRLDRLCLRALEKLPADRYPSAKALADALGEYLHTGDSTAWQVNDTARERKPANPIPAPAPPAPPIPPAPLKFNPASGSDRKPNPAPAPPPAAAGSRPAPVPPAPPAEGDDFEPLPAEDSGKVRQRVLLGGIALLLGLMLVGLVVILATSKKHPGPEKVEVPPHDQNPPPVVPNPNPPPQPKQEDPTPKKVEPPKKEEPKKAELPSIANGFAGHKFDQAAERRAAEWALASGGELKITPTAGVLTVVTKKENLPAAFTVSRIEIRKKPNLAEEEMKANLAGLSGPVEVLFWECGQVSDDVVKVLARIPKLKTLVILQGSRITDATPATLAGHPALTELFLQHTSVTKAGVKHVPSLTSLLKLTLVVPDTDEWLPWLAPMEGLTSLNLNASGPAYLNKGALRHLTPFKKLQHLTLLGRNVADDWMEPLVEVITSTDLYELDLREASIEGPGLVHLKKLPNLDWIDLSFSRVRDDGLTTLVASVPKLRWLFLDSTNITDAGLETLSKCKTLEFLTLKDNKKVTDKGVERLAGCPKLKELDLGNTEVGDSSAKALSKATALKKLILTGTGVSPKGIDELKKALPGCEIIQGK